MMISFTKPESLDGALLVDELLAAGVKLQANDRHYANVQPPFLDGENVLWLAIDSKDKTKAESVVTAHNA